MACKGQEIARLVHGISCRSKTSRQQQSPGSLTLCGSSKRVDCSVCAPNARRKGNINSRLALLSLASSHVPPLRIQVHSLVKRPNRSKTARYASNQPMLMCLLRPLTTPPTAAASPTPPTLRAYQLGSPLPLADCLSSQQHRPRDAHPTHIGRSAHPLQLPTPRLHATPRRCSARPSRPSPAARARERRDVSGSTCAPAADVARVHRHLSTHRVTRAHVARLVRSSSTPPPLPEAEACESSIARSSRAQCLWRTLLPRRGG